MAKKHNRRWTVVVRYPDYATSEWPDDIYTAWVKAADEEAAVVEAQKKALAAQDKETIIRDAADFGGVAVFPGHHRVWIPG